MENQLYQFKDDSALAASSEENMNKMLISNKCPSEIQVQN